MAEEEIKPPIEVIIDASIISKNQEETNISKLSESSILTRLHAGYFRISLSLGGQALLWKILSESKSDSQEVWHLFRILPSTAFLLLWWLAFLTQISLSLLYILRCLFHFHMVKAEFLHYIGLNYLYAPWISWILLLQSTTIISPSSVSYLALFWVFTVPVVVLDVKIYGQWFTTEKRFLSTLANPTSLMSVIGNLVVAQAAAQMGWTESATCMFSLGMVHYLVLFITLYQRLSVCNHFPAMLRPAFFLFFAAPSIASTAWYSISGSFHTMSKMLFFLSLFLFTSLACRPALFRKSMRRVNVAWWAYSFPVTSLALASALYAKEVKGYVAPGLTLALSALSVLVFLGLMVLTAFNTDKLLRQKDPVLSFAKDLRTRT
ncbi:putative SLAC1 [Tripterygium wilfordii]|uniref:Putative SLAC1 n=1 Tax=Tripterygium wilfordii TaxID=458696 RepID=A0A7J7D762_TRIWF|nr:S-type anion channel SLAH1-like [Tripterygium wilfordii]KAF5742153.1 putative SLAC1 [Tripterygium wilfordii]